MKQRSGGKEYLSGASAIRDGETLTRSVGTILLRAVAVLHDNWAGGSTARQQACSAMDSHALYQSPYVCLLVNPATESPSFMASKKHRALCRVLVI